MIALYEDLDREKVVKKKPTKVVSASRSASQLPVDYPVSDIPAEEVHTSGAGLKAKMAQLLRAFADYKAARKQRKFDNLALRQLMQLDDALLKDMGLTRSELHAIKSGSLSFDALVKRNIVSNRDDNLSTTSLRK